MPDESRPSVRAAMHALLRLSGVEAQSVWTAHAAGRTHHLELGSGSPVVLLHGGTGGGANWFRVFGALASRFRLLAPDLPGFGLSDPIDPTFPMGVAAAARLREWLDAVGVQRALLVGTSFGGLAALRLVQVAPERVAGLFLLDTAGLGRGIHPTVRFTAATPLTSLLMRPTRPGTAAVFRTLLTSSAERIPTPARLGLVEYLYASAVAAGTPYLAATLRLAVDARGQREVLEDTFLRSIRVPVTVMWGERDRLLPLAHARRAAALIPGATQVVVEGVGHSPNWEEPERVSGAVVELADRVWGR